MDNNILKNLPKGLIASVQSIMDSTKPVETKHVQVLNENLVGNQHKIDANKNGKIDAHDFKLLRRKKTVKKALDAGVKVEDLIQFNSPMQPDLHEEVGVVVHRDSRDGTIHVVVEGMKYKLKKGQVKEVSEELLGELSIGTMKSYGDKRARTAFSGGRKPGESVDSGIKTKSKQINSLALSKTKINRVHDTGSTVLNKEEVEPIEELKGATVKSYLKKSEADRDYNAKRVPIDPENTTPEKYAFHSNEARKRNAGMRMATKKLASGLSSYNKEEVEQIDEVSKETMLGYKKGAEAQVAASRKPGKPSKAAIALRVKRGAGLEKVKSKLEDIYKKESAARMAEREKTNNDIDAHFDKNHHAVLEKHGFKLMAQGETPEHEVKTYIHPHKNGHATIISIQKKKEPDSRYGGYRHEVRAVNTKGTSYSAHHPNTGFNSDAEEHKTQMMPKFEGHVIHVKNEGALDSRY